MNEIDYKYESAEGENKKRIKEAMLERRQAIIKDLKLLECKPHYFIKLDGNTILNNEECINLLIEYKKEQVKEIDKILGI